MKRTTYRSGLRGRFTGRRHYATRCFVLAALTCGVVLPSGIARAEETTFSAPYTASRVENRCGAAVGAAYGVCGPSPMTSADATTGNLRAGATMVGTSYCVPWGCGDWGARSSARIEAVHELAHPASSIDYVVTVDVKDVFEFGGAVVLAAGAERAGCWWTRAPEVAPLDDGRVDLSFNLSNAGGVITPGPITIWVELRASVWSTGPASWDAHGEASVSSISAIANPADMSTDSINIDHVAAYKDESYKATKRIDLYWVGGCGQWFELYRDGNVVGYSSPRNDRPWRSGNEGWFHDVVYTAARRTYVYKVCEAGTSVCSAEIPVQV